MSKNYKILPGQERFVSKENLVLDNVDNFEAIDSPKSIFRRAWDRLRRNPLFIICALLILLILLVAAFPQLFTSNDPLECSLSNSLGKSSPSHIFGFDLQGCDLFATVIYGARSSVIVGVVTTILATFIGTILGSLAGYYGGVMDAILGRVIDIFFAIPMLLGAIVILQVLQNVESIWKVVLVLSLFGWTNIARMARGAVIEAKNKEFITASKALGINKFACLMRHIMPNAIAPIIVTATVNLGTFIVSEATLSFLGLGLPSNVVSWGAAISNAQSLLRVSPFVVFYPSFALALTVFAFILLGDLVKDALNPNEGGR